VCSSESLITWWRERSSAKMAEPMAGLNISGAALLRNACHPSGGGSPPGLKPWAHARLMYLRMAGRLAPKLLLMARILRPACQWFSISATSRTVKTLLANRPVSFQVNWTYDDMFLAGAPQGGSIT